MAAPIGNDFWKLRRDFEGDGKILSLETLFTKAQEYVEYCLNNPLIETDFRGKDATMVLVPKMRAMNKWGLCHHLGISTDTLDNWAKDDSKYLDIITQVKQMMFAYKLEGAAAGLLHANIIARELGLKEQSEVNTNANISILNIDPLADGE